MDLKTQPDTLSNIPICVCVQVRAGGSVPQRSDCTSCQGERIEESMIIFILFFLMYGFPPRISLFTT